MEIRALAKNIRMSPRKVRLVLNLIKGKNVQEAFTQLGFVIKAATKPVKKVLQSATANALHNYDVQAKDLVVKKAVANSAMPLKRWLPRAMGRATPILKRGCHIEIVLEVLGKVKEIAENKKSVFKEDKIKDPVLSGSEKVVAKKNLKPGAAEEQEKKIFDPRMKGKHRHQQHLDKREIKGKGGFKTKIFNRKTDS